MTNFYVLDMLRLGYIKQTQQKSMNIASSQYLFSQEPNVRQKKNKKNKKTKQQQH